MNQIQTAPGNGLEVLASVKKQIDMLADQCRNVVISDAQSLERAKSLAKQAKLIENYIEDKRKELTKPILDRKKAIDDLAKSLTKELTEAVKHLREQIPFEKLAEIETKAAELSEKSKNLREVWTFEVVDISLVPREYLVLDETAVRRAIQNGVREIPGLKIFKKAQLVIK
jgi:SMC interacting uncharacterized protein involved in chromosome segregation